MSLLNKIIFYSVVISQNISTIGYILFIKTNKKKKNKFSFKAPTSQSKLLDMQPKYTVSYEYSGSQSENLDKKLNRSVRVAFTDTRAYWISDNTFYSAECSDGEVLTETAQAVDMFTASDKELQTYMVIIDSLKE